MGTTSVQRSRIFISYRREDAEQAAGRLAADLRKHFKREQVFEDIASIDFGADFMDALRDGLESCAAMIVVIGPTWVTITDKQGRRRLDLADDWVRQEVAYALKAGVRVIPVLVGHAEMPSSDALPQEIQPLTRRQAMPLVTRHWDKDVELLADRLKSIPGLDGKLAVAPVPPVAPSEPGAANQAAPELPPGTTFRDGDLCPEMVVIPAGRFTMGSPSNEQGRSDDEGPQHLVTIPRPFAVGKYAVTFDDWDACVREGGCAHNPDDNGWGRGRRPVINVSWNDVMEYIQWLSARTGKTYRLMSEAEWEYAARAGSSTPFHTGMNINPTQANYNTTVSFAGSATAPWPQQTVPVGSYDPNKFGLYEVHGNVWEWTEDCWNGNYNGAPKQGEAWTSGDCGRRVLRGGSWGDSPQYRRYPQLRCRFPCRQDALKSLILASLRLGAPQARWFFWVQGVAWRNFYG
jgi:formylglycine-generating enzyme required for sulfatase activity